MTEAPQEKTTGTPAERLIVDYQAAIWRYLRAMGCEASLADDLTQETFLAALQRPFQDINPAATSAYLRTIAKNFLISHHRRAGKVKAVENVELLDRTWSNWAGNDDGSGALDALRDCLQGLGDRAKQALELRFRQDSSREEIAAALKLSEDGAKNILQRAKQKLRDCIEQKLNPPEKST